MARLKPIMPSLKENKRYLVYEVFSEAKITNDLSKEVVSKLKEIMGVFDSASAGIQHVDYNKVLSRGVIRVATKSLDKIKTSLALVNQLNDDELAIRTIGVSGILKKAKSKYLAS